MGRRARPAGNLNRAVAAAKRGGANGAAPRRLSVDHPYTRERMDAVFAISTCSSPRTVPSAFAASAVGNKREVRKSRVQSHLPQFRNESFEIAGWIGNRISLRI